MAAQQADAFCQAGPSCWNVLEAQSTSWVSPPEEAPLRLPIPLSLGKKSSVPTTGLSGLQISLQPASEPVPGTGDGDSGSV